MNHATGPFLVTRPPQEPAEDDREPINVPRLYLAESGWRIIVKAGTDRDFCYMMAPGQDFYHRLLDGEVFFQRNEEKLCLACASRRGLLVPEPRRLREAVLPLPADDETLPLELGWLDPQ